MDKKIKKIIPYFLILVILIGIGFFSSPGKVNAMEASFFCDAMPTRNKTAKGQDCFAAVAACTASGPIATTGAFRQCTDNWTPSIGQPPPAEPINALYKTCVGPGPLGGGIPTDCALKFPDSKYDPQGNLITPAATQQTDFEDYVKKNGCSLWSDSGIVKGCLIEASYWLFYALPALILYWSAYFFNVLISVTLGTALFRSPFLSTAWAVVRDLSNLFFILILLYIAIKIILGLGGSEVKKMIARVIIIALLINFSMFFTGVVIDSSNILALVFYNKLNVQTTNPGGSERPYQGVSGEKDVAGGMVNAFDPTRLLTADFFKEAGTIDPGITGVQPQKAPVSASMLIGITILAGSIMFYAAYCLFIAAISFLGRMIELFVRIVFSPFALMSSTIPILSKVEYIGWDNWKNGLLKSAFMAPIFMFFVYFIFLLIRSKMFDSLVTQTNQGTLVRVLSVVIPAAIILILLKKATEYAKKGSGVVGEVLAKGAATVAGVVGGAALGAGIGAAAVAGRATVGRAGAAAANSKWAQRWESHGFGGEYFRRGAAAVGSGSFDARGVKIAGKDLAGATGMKLGDAQKGGFTARRQAQVESRMKRAKELEVGEDNVLKQNLNELETQKQGLLMDVSHDIEQLDNRLKVWRERAADTSRAARLNAGGDSGLRDATGAVLTNQQANILSENNLAELRQHRNAIKNGVDFTPTAVSAINPAHAGHVQTYSTRTRVGGVTTGASINELEDNLIPQAHHAIQHENRRIRGVYADTTEGTFGRVKNAFFSGGQSSHKGSREAAHKIRMETKIEDKGSGH